MRPTFASAALAFAIASALLAGEHVAAVTRKDRQAPRRELHVLLIGNSYLYYNNTPRLLEAIADSTAGPTLHTELVAHGGWTLADHWDNDATRAALASRRWDWIVLNEQSTFGDTYFVDGQPRVHSSAAFENSVAKFAGAARELGTRLAVVAHWPTRSAPARDRAALRYAFETAARAYGVVLIPAAEAWTEAARRARHVPLYDADGSHPSPAGSYLLAGLLYASLTARSPAGATHAITGDYIDPDDGVVQSTRQVSLVDLSASHAARLQHAAWHAFQRASRQSRAEAPHVPAPIRLPRLPSSTEPVSAVGMAGTWRGSTTIYPVTPAATLELTLQASGDTLTGTLRRTLGPAPDATETGEVVVSIERNVVTIVDPRGPNRGSVVYKGVMQRGRLVGIVEFVVPVPMVYGIGSWTLAKAD